MLTGQRFREALALPRVFGFLKGFSDLEYRLYTGRVSVQSRAVPPFLQIPHHLLNWIAPFGLSPIPQQRCLLARRGESGEIPLAIELRLCGEFEERGIGAFKGPEEQRAEASGFFVLQEEVLHRSA